MNYFKPKYGKELFIVLILLAAILALGIFVYTFDKSLETKSNLIFIIILIIFLIFMSLKNFYKSVEFGDKIIFKRHIFPKKVINYNDILGYDDYSIITLNGRIQYNIMTNSNSFLKSLKSNYYNNLGLKRFPKGNYILRNEFGYKILRITFPIVPLSFILIYIFPIEIPFIILIFMVFLLWGIISLLIYKICINSYLKSK